MTRGIMYPAIDSVDPAIDSVRQFVLFRRCTENAGVQGAQRVSGEIAVQLGQPGQLL